MHFACVVLHTKKSLLPRPGAAITTCWGPDASVPTVGSRFLPARQRVLPCGRRQACRFAADEYAAAVSGVSSRLICCLRAGTPSGEDVGLPAWACPVWGLKGGPRELTRASTRCTCTAVCPRTRFRSLGSQRGRTTLGSCPAVVLALCHAHRLLPFALKPHSVWDACVGETFRVAFPSLRQVCPAWSKCCFTFIFGVKRAHSLWASKCWGEASLFQKLPRTPALGGWGCLQVWPRYCLSLPGSGLFITSCPSDDSWG